MRYVPWKAPRSGDADRGSMPLAILLTTVALAGSAAMVPYVVRQADENRNVTRETETLDVAQTGLDVALAQVRAAKDGDDAGFLDALPCSVDGPKTLNPVNPVDASGNPNYYVPYQVKIVYYQAQDPETGALSGPLACPLTKIPAAATFTVIGSNVPGAPLVQGGKDTRTFRSTYTFKTSDAKVVGGAIRLDQPTSPGLCLDSGGTLINPIPAVGAAVKMENCTPANVVPGSAQDRGPMQRFQYTRELNIKLAGSESSTAPDGLCLDAPVSPARKSGDAVKFQPCLGRNPRQQWSLDNSSNFRGTTDGVNLDSTCLNLKTAGKAGDPIVLGSCGGGANQRVFRPEAKVGAGMAELDPVTGLVPTNQLVNYQQFSRCLDVTNHDVNMSYMIAWYCKQAPDGSVSWNQRWTTPAPSTSAVNPTVDRIRTTGSGSPGVCLRSPRSTVATKYVTTVSCAATGTLTDASLKWIVYGATGVDKTRYTIVDVDGNCLTPTDLTVASPDTHGDGTAKVKVAVCDGSDLQKWNAPASFKDKTGLSDTVEVR
ncbi:ricin-type beta-trefoil lectin protein [Krasilnikovia cinnamomea]|uniref:Ricin-type beta-trefoil lectin protein n=1 Tax=Krasilnikovia cinnamomea TaxID=349313 RepID=A0A4Q7ZMK7_9ACTN|nr:ricin-type beta-trefoil lectin domain protein [Krasilnikovia cinnamomea]RZU52237.1 ricin-type beta-trefoil lectin protein [Krasilnikovia cinnamomea]